jgi:hypothetical protein
MFTAIIPKLPMRSKNATISYYIKSLGFEQVGGDFPDYLMIEKDSLEIHFFLFTELNVLENYGQIYIRTEAIDLLYQSMKTNGVTIHPNAALQTKPWGVREFSLLDPDHNLITFGQIL